MNTNRACASRNAYSERGNYEAVYGNMPVFGLAKAIEHVRAVGGRETARRRLMRGDNEPAVPSPE